MTIQLTALETSDPRLLMDTYKQNSSDLSFEKKLKSEQARLGLDFNPFAQIDLLFSSPLELSFSQTAPDKGNDSVKTSQRSGSDLPEPPQNSNSNKQVAQVTAQIFESAGLQPLNRQLFQELLSRANLLVPNLAAQPFFDQAFQAGQLRPKFDLQFLIDQLIEQVKLVKNKNRTELSLTLKPEDLGEIYLQLTSLAGKISVLISASPETKKLIDTSKTELEMALKKAHVNLDRVTIEEAKKNA